MTTDLFYQIRYETWFFDSLCHALGDGNGVEKPTATQVDRATIDNRSMRYATVFKAIEEEVNGYRVSKFEPVGYYPEVFEAIRKGMSSRQRDILHHELRDLRRPSIYVFHEECRNYVKHLLEKDASLFMFSMDNDVQGFSYAHGNFDNLFSYDFKLRLVKYIRNRT